MKSKILTFLFILIIGKGFSQIKAPTLPSPNAAELGKYGEIPVNLSTGILNYGIPLVTARSGSLTFPVGLNYSYSGYRPNEEAGWVGRGWNLSAGGVIIRNQKGLPDEKDYAEGSPNNVNGGYLITIDEVNRLYNETSAATPLSNSFGNLIDSQFDSEPDIFTISCGNLTGKFYYGYTNTAKTEKGFIFISRKNVKIEGNVSSIIDPAGGNSKRISSFIITDEAGTKYYFDIPEFAWQNPLILIGSPSDDYTVSTWHISKIESQKGEKIEFIYKDTNPSNLKNFPRKQIVVLNRAIFSPQTTIDLGGGCGVQNIQPGQIKIDEIIMSSTEIILSEIKSHESTIYFTSAMIDRNMILSIPGLKSYYHKLSKIEQKDVRHNSVLTWEFNYNNVISQNNEFLLKNLQEVVNGNKKPSYKFDYNAESSFIGQIGSDLYYRNLPIDRWDYYNGIYNKVGTTGSLLESEQAIRVSTLAATKYGVLEKITYPTGGYTQFDYELNNYSKLPGEETTVWNPATSTEVSISPSNVNELDYYKEIYSRFLYRNGAWQFEEEVTPAFFPFTPSASTKCVVTFQGQGSECAETGCDVCCQISNFSSQTFNLTAGTQYDANYFLPSSLRELIVNNNNPYTHILLKFKFSSYVNVLNAPRVTAGGIRIREIQNYDENNNLVNTKSYKYERKEGSIIKSSGQVYRRPKYQMNTFNAVIKMPSNAGGLPSIGIIPISIWENSGLVNALQSFSGSYVLYEEVQEYVNGTLFHDYHFSNMNDYKLTQNMAFLGSPETTFIGNVELADFAIGIQKKNESFKTIGTSSSLLMSEINNYTNLVNLKTTKISSPAINMQTMGYINYPLCTVTVQAGQTVYTITNVPSPIFSVRKYNVDNYRFDLVSSQTVEVISPTAQIEKLVEYFPSPNHYLPYKTKTINSDGTIDEVTTKTPLDYSETAGRAAWITDMINKNIFSPVIEQQVTKTRTLIVNDLPQTTTKVTGAKLTVYKKNADAPAAFPNIVPDREYVFDSDIPVTELPTTAQPNKYTFFKGTGTTNDITTTTYPTYRHAINYDAYDSYNNLTQATPIGGETTSYLWSYKGNYPVATIKNASIATVNTKVGAGFVDLTDNSAINSKINEVRNEIPNTLVESAVYTPMVGVVEKTDPSGLKTTFTYDKLNRLEYIKDNDLEIVKSYKYNFGRDNDGIGTKTVKIEGQLNAGKSQIDLAWVFTASADVNTNSSTVVAYEISRSIGNQPLKLWVTLPGDNTTKIDASYTPDQNIYNYSIRAILKDGTATAWQPLTITLPTGCTTNMQIVRKGLILASKPIADKACYEINLEEGFVTEDNAEYTGEIGNN